MKNKKVALSVFLISFILGLNVVGVTPILGVLKERYSEYGTTMIQLLQSAVYLLIIVGALLLGWFTTKFSKKKIATIAAVWVGVFGLIPMLFDGFEVMLVCRIMIGFGYGLLNPLTLTIIADLVEPEERAGYMGMHVVGMGTGAIVGNMLGGVLAGIGYQYFYLIYLIPFLCMAGIQFTLPKMLPVERKKVKSAKLNGKVYAILAASLFQLLLLDAFSINAGIYMAEFISESTALMGIVNTINAIFALLTGITFAKLTHKFGLKVIAYAVFLGALGYLAVFVVPGIAGVFICSATGGICRSCLGAGFGLMIANAVQKEATSKAGGLNTVVSSVGGLMAPTILGNAATFVMGENTASNQLMIALVGMTIFGIVLWFAISKFWKKKIS